MIAYLLWPSASGGAPARASNGAMRAIRLSPTLVLDQQQRGLLVTGSF
jgi:hypothetical protein